MDVNIEMCESLLKWLISLDLDSEFNSLEDLSDGLIVMKALLQIDSGYFDPLQSKLKEDASVNWRIKARNLKKILESITDYYQEVLNLHLVEIAKPDVMKIAEKLDKVELGKLLRLVLGTAINCESKQKYITGFMRLEESVQQCIMLAIQQLEELYQGRGRVSMNFLSLETDSRVQKLVADIETLSQKIHNLESQITCLTEEKSNLLQENQKLQERVDKLESTTTTDSVPSIDSAETRRRITMLKEELFKAETVRDDYQLKIIEQGKIIQTMQEKISELQTSAGRALQLKDEVDALSETVEKVQILETSLASYKKRLEEFGDIKKQLKILEEKNMEYYQANLSYEEELKKQNVLKSQMEVYKEQVAQLHQELTDEVQKNDKLAFENEKLEAKVSTLQREKERLLVEKNALVEANEELKCKVNDTNKDDAAVARELMPSELQQLVRHLEKENKRLRLCEEEVATKEQLLADAQRLAEKYADINRTANRRLMQLETLLQDSNHSGSVNESSTGTGSSKNEESLNAYKQKCTALQEALTSKENELRLLEEKYRKSIDKAKTIVRDLEPNSNSQQYSPVASSMSSGKVVEERSKSVNENRLIATAFYRLSNACQREAVNDRLAAMSAVQGQSFLSRQRQPTARKPIAPFKSK